MDEKSYYEILGLSQNATDKQIRSAYKKLAAKYHPDKNKDDNAKEMFTMVYEAYSVLIDPHKGKCMTNMGKMV